MMPQPSERPTRILLAISLFQGLCLYLLYISAEAAVWPANSPVWSYPLWTLAVIAPLLLLLSVTRQNIVYAVKNVGAFCALLVLLAIYTGWQAEPFDEVPLGSLTLAFVATIGIASFKALMYLQQRADGVELTYPLLFTNSWRNFLVGALAALFTLIFWLILQLWGQLFNVIGIDVFTKLFAKDWFAIPINTVAFGLGVVLFRNLARVIDSVTQLLHWLIKLLLPLVIALAVIFVSALPFTGLELLWDTGNGTGLLLWLLALTLFFINAVYQDGREANPYPRLLHRAIYIGAFVTPVISGLAFYGLLLRLQQYGWTVERCWAFVAWFVLSLFAIGYVVGIVRRRDRWTDDLARVNTAMGLVVLGIMLLANSPLLDFRKISLASQLERVDSGEIALAEFDFWYAKNHLARPAYLAMERMKTELGESDPDLLAAIENPMPRFAAMPGLDPDEIWQGMHYRPEPFEVPADLRRLIEMSFRVSGDFESVLIAADLNEDGASEYILLLLSAANLSAGNPGSLNAQLYHRDENGWGSSYMPQTARASQGLRERILTGEITLQDPEYKNIAVGGIELRPMPRNGVWPSALLQAQPHTVIQKGSTHTSGKRIK